MKEILKEDRIRWMKKATRHKQTRRNYNFKKDNQTIFFVDFERKKVIGKLEGEDLSKVLELRISKLYEN